jgi:hypothetical protein
MGICSICCKERKVIRRAYRAGGIEVAPGRH